MNTRQSRLSAPPALNARDGGFRSIVNDESRSDRAVSQDAAPNRRRRGGAFELLRGGAGGKAHAGYMDSRGGSMARTGDGWSSVQAEQHVSTSERGSGGGQSGPGSSRGSTGSGRESAPAAFFSPTVQASVSELDMEKMDALFARHCRDERIEELVHEWDTQHNEGLHRGQVAKAPKDGRDYSGDASYATRIAATAAWAKFTRK